MYCVLLSLFVYCFARGHFREEAIHNWDWQWRRNCFLRSSIITYTTAMSCFSMAWRLVLLLVCDCWDMKTLRIIWRIRQRILHVGRWSLTFDKFFGSFKAHVKRTENFNANSRKLFASQHLLIWTYHNGLRFRFMWFWHVVISRAAPWNSERLSDCSDIDIRC